MSSRLKSNSFSKTFSLKKINNIKIGIVVSDWHPEVTEELYNGALKVLIKCGIKKENILRKNVPGSFELPLGAQILLNKKYNAAICLGCVIKGETDHYQFICEAVANGIMNVSLSHNKPVAFGVLTTNNLPQALNRAGGKLGNKGEDAAIAILQMLALKN